MELTPWVRAAIEIRLTKARDDHETLLKDLQFHQEQVKLAINEIAELTAALESDHSDGPACDHCHHEVDHYAWCPSAHSGDGG